MNSMNSIYMQQLRGDVSTSQVSGVILDLFFIRNRPPCVEAHRTKSLKQKKNVDRLHVDMGLTSHDFT